MLCGFYRLFHITVYLCKLDNFNFEICCLRPMGAEMQDESEFVLWRTILRSLLSSVYKPHPCHCPSMGPILLHYPHMNKSKLLKKLLIMMAPPRRCRSSHMSHSLCIFFLFIVIFETYDWCLIYMWINQWSYKRI